MQAVPQIPGYDLLRPLGGGSITCVYSARDGGNADLCAVKVLRKEHEKRANSVKLLQREARIGLTVRHPHLVHFLDAHVTLPPYFLVMELLPGESLRARLRRDYRLEFATCLWAARQTAEALAALHRAGFVHGDLKPDNIRLVDDGTAKLLDFGFAHRPGENASALRRGVVMGTANYLAPELCAFDASADESTDLFSLGVTLFETLTGRLPYPPGSTNQTLYRHRCDPPADIRLYTDSLPSAFITLIERLLARQPAERPRARMVVQQLIALEIASLRTRRTA